jgi:hypothetical protein
MCFVLGYQLVEAVDTLGEERGHIGGVPHEPASWDT